MKRMKEIGYMGRSGSFRVIDKEGREWQIIEKDGLEIAVRKIDNTHFAMVTADSIETASPVIWHVAQMKNDSDFYQELVKWLSGREMIGGKMFENTEDVVNVPSSFKLSDGTLIKKGASIRVISDSTVPMKEGLESVEEPFYSSYASAIINGDYSGLDDEEEEVVEEFLKWVKKNYGRDAQITDVSEESYFGTPPQYMRGFAPLAGDLLDYTILFRE